MIGYEPADIVSEVIARYLSSNRIRPADVDIYKYLSTQIRWRLFDATRYSRRQLLDIEDVNESQFIEDMAPEEEEFDVEERRNRARNLLMDRPLLLRIFDETLQGRTSSTDIASRLGISTREVELARRQLRRLLSTLVK
jgi:DNA-directed RNA polymerase specialized sigma24 family protein